MFNGNFELTGDTLKIVEEIGRHMPGGFFIYKAEKPEELIYANKALFDIFGCDGLDDFKKYTGYTFKGMLHPEDYERISDSIVDQINTNDDNMDYVEYRIIRKDGQVRWVDDFGHYTDTKTYGGVYFVFISDITEKRDRRELESRARAAEEGNRAKSNFLSNMSHEIRTPITAILGMNELIRRESKDEHILEYSGNIEKAGNSLLSIVNDILDFSKIEAGRMELINVNYVLSDLLGDLYNLIRFRIEEKGLLFQANIDPHLPAILNGDELRLKQIVTNLLTNAAKYTERGVVELSVKLVDKTKDYADIFFAVRDTGIGIRPEEMGKLFSEFDRLDVTHTRGIEGTGLGLAITSRMLKLMDSSLEVESIYGEGSSFSFTIRQKIVGDGDIGEFAPSESTGSPGGENDFSTSFTAPSARILIVDDTPLNLQVIVGLLKPTEIVVDTASSGKECIEKFGHVEYDMVFLDYRMPEMDGIETLKELRGAYPEKADTTPILCLTASAVVGDRERMLIAGFDDYLPKPVNAELMEHMLIRYLPKEKLIPCVVSAERGNQDEIPEELFEIEELDPKAGLEYCGDAEDYMDALSVYAASVTEKSTDIEKALKDRDADKYTNMVHSLKSTSRAVGALDIAELSQALENAGKSRDFELMEKYTPELLVRYRALKKSLDELFEE